MQSRRRWRWVVWLTLAVGGLFLIGWFQHTQQSWFTPAGSEYEPVYPTQHPTEEAIRQLALLEPNEKVRLERLAQQFTARFRQYEVPLRARFQEGDESPMRLYAAMSVPRWYIARVARQLWRETFWATGREHTLPIYETYIFGQSRQIGVCERNPQTGEVEVRLVW